MHTHTHLTWLIHAYICSPQYRSDWGPKVCVTLASATHTHTHKLLAFLCITALLCSLAFYGHVLYLSLLSACVKVCVCVWERELDKVWDKERESERKRASLSHVTSSWPVDLMCARVCFSCLCCWLWQFADFRSFRKKPLLWLVARRSPPLIHCLYRKSRLGRCAIVTHWARSLPI